MIQNSDNFQLLRIQVAGLRKRAAGDEPGDVETVQTQKLVEPLFDGVSWSVADGLVEGDLVERASCVGGQSVRRTAERHAVEPVGPEAAFRRWSGLTNQPTRDKTGGALTCSESRRVRGLVLRRRAQLAVGTLLPQLLDQLEGEGATGAFIPAHGGTETGQGCARR